MFKNYLLMAYAVFMRRKLFTAINLLCITLTLIVLMVITALLQNAFHPKGVEGKSDRFLQVVIMTAKGKDDNGIWNSPIGYKLIDKYLRPLKSVEAVAAVSVPETVSVYQADRVHELQMRRADAAYWTILDFKVLDGRVPTADDVERGRFVAVLNQTSAEKIFSTEKAVGKKLAISGQQFEIIGVVEDVLQMNSFADIWAPVTTYPSSEYRNLLIGHFTALLLAKSPADLPTIQAEVAAVAKTVTFDDPNTWSRAYFWADSKIDAFSRTILDNGDKPESGATTLILIIIFLMFLFMLLPALNLVNLNTGRILERATEIGVRKAFGASSAQLLWQLLVENVLLSLFGGLLGFIGTAVVLWWLEGSKLIPYLKVEMDMAIFAYGLLLTVVFGLLSGLIPAWKMSRLDPVHALKGAA